MERSGSDFRGILLFGGSMFLIRKALQWNNRKTIVQCDLSATPIEGIILGDKLPENWFTIRSEQRGNEKCEIEVVNSLNHSRLIFCWIGFDGTLYHFRTVNDCSIKDGSVPNFLVEYGTVYHAFVCYRYLGEDSIEKIGDLNPTSIIFIIQPTDAVRYTLNITELGIAVSIKTIVVPIPLCDSLNKKYVCRVIAGFTLFLEQELLINRMDVMNSLEMDLEAVSRLLPTRPLELLQRLTPIFVNLSLLYGTVTSPVTGRHMCYHPDGGSTWLQAHGLNPAKSGSVEINCADDYLQSRDLWGTGGLLLHELCHAFHDKHTPSGYNCSIIRQAYDVAMSLNLYNSVNVHGKQGDNGPIKSYACANVMEFWAELSVAYHCKNPNLEFNKWYPHNASQLQSHDPHSFDIIHHLWNADDIPCNSSRLANEHL